MMEALEGTMVQEGLDGDPLENPREHDEGTGVGRRLHQVVRQLQFETGDPTQLLDGEGRVSGIGVDPDLEALAPYVVREAMVD